MLLPLFQLILIVTLASLIIIMSLTQSHVFNFNNFLFNFTGISLEKTLTVNGIEQVYINFRTVGYRYPH